MASDARRCGVPARSLPPCDLEWGHDGDLHGSAGDGFYARDYDEEHHWRQGVLRELRDADEARADRDAARAELTEALSAVKREMREREAVRRERDAWHSALQACHFTTLPDDPQAATDAHAEYVARLCTNVVTLTRERDELDRLRGVRRAAIILLDANECGLSLDRPWAVLREAVDPAAKGG